MITKSDLQKIKKREHLSKCSRWIHLLLTYLFFVYAVDIQTDVHINVFFLHLFYVKITLFNKDKMLEKVLKIKNFHPFFRCSNTTHSTCCICGTQKVWVNLLRINSVLPTSSHTRHDASAGLKRFGWIFWGLTPFH